MQYASFADSGRKVSRLCFGAMGLNFAFGQFEQKSLMKAMHLCTEHGINMIDTARIYGGSEHIVGQFLKEVPKDSIFVATKVAPSESPTNAGWGIPNPINIAYPKDATTKSVETSLRELDIESIDLIPLHQ